MKRFPSGLDNVVVGAVLTMFYVLGGKCDNLLGVSYFIKN